MYIIVMLMYVTMIKKNLMVNIFLSFYYIIIGENSFYNIKLLKVYQTTNIVYFNI